MLRRSFPGPNIYGRRIVLWILDSRSFIATVDLYSSSYSREQSKKNKEYVLFPGLCAPTAISVPQCFARCRQKGSAVLWNEARSRGAFQHSDVQHLEMGAVRYKLRQV
jgi:hypothetical protein